MKWITKLTAAFLAIMLFVTPSIRLIPVLADEPFTYAPITISSYEELLELSNNCRLDTWSQGRTVTLTEDIDLSGREFAPIPTFGGVFDGNGHTISGMSLNQEGSVLGLFRYIQEGGVVKNLSVTGELAPAGTAGKIGGIAGINCGSIRGCTFTGSISGAAIVGGIAGVNETTGQISTCTVQGVITAEHFTGGIAGQNLGSVIKCVNNSSINTSAAEITLDLESMNLENLNSTENISGHTDTGGIAGFSSGILSGCSNYGTIGYQHMGYNVGGIAGRQAGYLDNCSNYGKILGRKEVGGIVGQMEPNIIRQYSEDSLQRLDKELDTLDSVISAALTHMDNSADTISGRFTSISQYTSSARESSHDLLKQTSGFVDNNIDTVNDISTSINSTLDKMTPILDDITYASQSASDVSYKLQDVADEIRRASRFGSKTADELERAGDQLEHASASVQSALAAIRSALKLLADSIIEKDEEAKTQALVDLSQGLGNLSAGFGDSKYAITDLRTALSENTDWSGISADREQLLMGLGSLSSSMDSLRLAASKLSESAASIMGKPDWDVVKEVFSLASGSLADLENAFQSAGKAVDDIRSALSYTQDAADALSRSAGRLKSALNSLSDASDAITGAVRGLKNLVSDLASKDPYVFTPLGSGFSQASDRLNDAMADLSTEMEHLNTDVHNAGKTLTSDLQAVNQQFHVVIDVLIDAMAMEGLDYSSLMEDTSEEDIKNTQTGKVQDSINHGFVQGDLNVGGITGAMAIEYDFDPEDDIHTQGKESMNFKYETKAIIDGCINNGEIEGKKDSIGGIAGKMDLGILTDCESYGPVTSKGGSYVGGIAGQSESKIQNSFSKCSLSGSNYIGGIAGYGKHITGCYSFIDIRESAEYAGAIAGEQGDEVTGNYFLDRGIAGIDGISYSGIAEPVSYEDFKSLPNLPKNFFQLSLSYYAGEELLDVVYFLYGEDLSGITPPQIPEKEGYTASWPEFDYSSPSFSTTLEAEYIPLVTLLSSQETSQSGKNLPLALAEGAFGQNARLSVTDSTEPTPIDIQGQSGALLHVSLCGSSLLPSDRVPIRLLSPDKEKTFKIYEKHGDFWEEIPCQANGSYLLLTMTGTESDFYITAPSSGWLFMLCFILGGTIVLLVIILLVKKRKRKRSQKKTKDSAEE